MVESIHQFTVKNIKGEAVPLSQYKGKVLLIVNTASKCGFTPQLDDLEELYAEFKDKQFEVLAFPSNDFGDQEPLDGAAIEQFCMIDYKASYPIFDKVHVVGSDAIDLFKFLSDKKRNGKVAVAPSWNFHKYLVDQEGRVVDFFYMFTKPTASRVKRKIKALL